MNTALRIAQSEVTKLKRYADKSGDIKLDIMLVFDRSEEDMKRLAGYTAFAEALESLGGAHTKESIEEACRISNFSKDSVYFDDMQDYEEAEDPCITLSVKCTRQQASALKYRHSFYNDF